MARRLAIPAGVVLLALLLRAWHLEALPAGLHGDEAVTGLDARRALAEGWIGPYLYPSALGQPAGPVYLTALVFALLGESAFALRLSMALFAAAAVGFTWLAAKAMFGRRVALLAALLLAIQPWHLHLGRIAFMVNAWPCVEMAALWLLFRARRLGGVGRWLLCGAVAGLGVYTYNAFALSLPVLATPVLCDLWRPPTGTTRRRVLALGAAAALAALIVALPMIDYARTHEEYFWHQEEVAVVHSPAWRDASWPERAAQLAARAGEWGRGVAFGGRPDDGDGLGDHAYPLLDPLGGLAALLGAAMALRRWRQPAHATLLVGLLVLPFGALLTIEDGLFRRTYGLAPLLAILGALPLAALWRRASGREAAFGRAILAVLAVALLGAGIRNAYRYFVPLQATEQMRYVFPPELDAAGRYIAGLPPDSAVFWYSDRWPADYATLRWWAPTATVIERSPPFGGPTEAEGRPLLAADSDRQSVFVLLGEYGVLSEELLRRHPGAIAVEQTTSFRAVRVVP